MVHPFFSSSTMVLVFFVYGLSFFVLGFVCFILAQKEKQFSIENYIWLLGAFGILHGLNEWIDMSLILGRTEWSASILEIIDYIRSLCLVSSFLCLFAFGFKNVFLRKPKLNRFISKLLISFFIVFTLVLLVDVLFLHGISNYFRAIDVLTRYTFGFTGSLLTAIAFSRFYHICKGKTVCHGTMNMSSVLMAVFFLLYGLVSGLIVPKMNFWPASMFNYDNFILYTGIPVQVFRTIFAFGTGICIFGILKVCHSSLIDDIKEEATVDPLTQLKNRRGFLSEIKALMSYSKRYHRPLSIIFFDIDKFKNFNDTYGHQAGDELLKLLGMTVKKLMRDQDLIFRYGGEEFVIVLPETALREATDVALRLKNRIEALPLKPANEVVHKTVSIGVVEYQEHYSIKEFLELADQAMYQAKENGRNRICIQGEKECIV